MEEKLDSNEEFQNKKEYPLKKDLDNLNDLNNQTKIVNKNSMDNNILKSKENNKQDFTEEKNNEDLSKKITNDVIISKPKKEIPIEKKPFREFINDHLLPSLISEFKKRGFIVEDISLNNTSRPIAGDKCWVINCEVKDTFTFWLSFEQEDISSLKSISLCKSSQKPSVIESFLIDEKRITLNLIISRILQRLNGQKLIGIN